MLLLILFPQISLVFPVISASSTQFQEAGEFQKSAVSNIVDRIKRRPSMASARTSGASKLDSEAQKIERERAEKARIESMQNELDNLNLQIHILSNQNPDTEDVWNEKEKRKMEKFKKDQEDRWSQAKHKLQMEKLRNTQLRQVSVQEDTEIERLREEYATRMQDAERADGIRNYLDGRKMDLFVLKRYHAHDRGQLTKNNVKLDKLHMENRALRQKELRRMELEGREPSEQMILDNNAKQMQKEIGKTRQENDKLRSYLDKVTLKH